ncbi:MAG: sigma-70 family RNA polymerase sigma factor [Solirubrobacterales bacterium]
MDESAERFARLYDEHIWTVYGFFGYRLGSREDAEDLTQQTFERALRAWGRFDERRAGPATWLLSIARNLLIDHHRADRSDRIEPIGEEGLRPEYEPAVEDRGQGVGLDPDLERALNGLNDREREILALRFGGDLTGPEIAGLTGLTVANVQQILSRCLRRLRAELDTAAARY